MSRSLEPDKDQHRMGGLSPVRRLLKLIHPEGIPWLGATFYNLISSTVLFQHQYELVARDILGYCSEGKVLDIGTGPGWLLLKLHQHSPGIRLFGLDASPSMVVKAQTNIVRAGLAGLIEIHEGSVTRIPFPDDFFDTVVSTGSIHHWKDPIGGLNEVYRVLKAGGYALMYDVVSDTPTSVLAGMAHQFGRLKTMLFWLHAFEEPFYSHKNFELLVHPTLFREGRTQFVGILCCLILSKRTAGNLYKRIL